MYIINRAQVESTYDDADGLRIKARLFEDGDTSIEGDDLFAFPLLPKTFQVVPKIGEMVLILTEEGGNTKSQRYYIGPIISQPQHFYKDNYIYGRGTATACFKDGMMDTLPGITDFSLKDKTQGAFPTTKDVAIVGRKSEDIILKDDEIDIRCGIRQKDISDDNLKKGFCAFNTENPSYIQLRHQNGLTISGDNAANSMVNIVADKVNIMSHKDTENPNAFVDQKELIKTDSLDEIMNKLHQVPYGDLLVEALQKIIAAIDNHMHAYPGLPPIKDAYLQAMDSIDLEEIKSKNVRIS